MNIYLTFSRIIPCKFSAALFAFRTSFRTLHKYRTELKRMMYGAIYINISGRATINQSRYQRDYNSQLTQTNKCFSVNRDQRINNYGPTGDH